MRDRAPTRVSNFIKYKITLHTLKRICGAEPPRGSNFTIYHTLKNIRDYMRHTIKRLRDPSAPLDPNRGLDSTKYKITLLISHVKLRLYYLYHQKYMWRQVPPVVKLYNNIL